ncbi:histone deacetylase [Thalassomonas viridans]|uniref:Histone deacetylase n=1 Tax=Thalassomonas viridans TaxID=137584 RepID=A0AAE9Z624_9GAMM|nr:histone deacetylase [Thalassomonas viridans]WDE06739.1 histone deacetylase [Thalassomonas viridans]
MLNVFYHDKFNMDLGLLNYLHPFDGMKFKKIYQKVANNPNVTIHSSDQPISQAVIDEFVDALIFRLLRHKVHIFRALELPNIPLISFNYLDKKILSAMRWGVAGTLAATKLALTGKYCWNLAGGYHHASPHAIEGFCIYNDIGICYQELLKTGALTPDDKILIIDTDAHHGNGNAATFMDKGNITILDVYNSDVYPKTYFTRNRIDVAVPMSVGVKGQEYLSRYQEALSDLSNDYKVAFVIAGTDVLATDPLGQMRLTPADVIEREKITLNQLKQLAIPAVFLGGGGYSKESAQVVPDAINELSLLS